MGRYFPFEGLYDMIGIMLVLVNVSDFLAAQQSGMFIVSKIFLFAYARLDKH